MNKLERTKLTFEIFAVNKIVFNSVNLPNYFLEFKTKNTEITSENL